MPRENHPRRFLDTDRDAEVFREVIQRAKRQHAKRDVMTGDRIGDTVHRAIAATSDHDVHARCNRSIEHLLHLIAGRRNHNPAFPVRLSEESFQERCGLLGGTVTRAAVQHGRHTNLLSCHVRTKRTSDATATRWTGVTSIVEGP